MSAVRPFKIQIFIAEGIPDGLRLVSKSNWVGLGVVCPRGRYPQVKERKEFERNGVYILIGREEEDLPTIYIGEAEKVRDRLNQHYANKDFWQQAIIFTTAGNPLNKAEVQYLEARLVELANKYNRCRLNNSNTPKHPRLSEADQAEIEGYLEELLSLLPVLGIDAFMPIESAASATRIYYLKGKNFEARGFDTKTGFTVQKGSLARVETVPSMKEKVLGYYKKRQQLIEENILVREAEGYRFNRDYPFTSSSQAASVCAGRSANGFTEWKDREGTSLKKSREQEAEAERNE